MRPSQVLDQHRQAIRDLEKHYVEKGITNFRVIGSVANGTDTEESDIDFLVDAGKKVSLFTIGGLYSDLEDIVQMRIDLVISDEIPNYFKNRILAEAKPI